MGNKDPANNGRSYDALNAQRTLRRIMPALKRVVTCPEKLSKRERALIIELLFLALLAPDTALTCRAAEVLVAMVGENQHRLIQALAGVRPQCE